MKMLKHLIGGCLLMPLLMACGSDDPVTDEGNKGEGNKDEQVDESPEQSERVPNEEDPAWWGTDEIAATIADSSFCYYNRAFLLHRADSEDGMTYFSENQTSTHWAYYWNQALIILMLADRYECMGDEKMKPLITEALYAFLEHEKNPTTNDTFDWTWNNFTDDLLWAGLAFIRGYQITGEERFLEQAKWDWDYLYNRAYDTQLGGGLWWKVSNPSDKEHKADKSGLSNNPAVSMACYLYEATGDESYLEKAKSIYEWIYSTLRQPNGAVDEKITKDGTRPYSYNVYNVGAFIEASNALYQVTKNDFYKEAAKTSIEFVMTEKVTDKGIMSKWHRDGTWQSEFARGMGLFVHENNLWDEPAVYTKSRKPTTYYEWMKLNAKAAWETHNKDYLTFNEWANTTPQVPESGKTWTALEMVSSVVMTQVTPEKKP